MQPRLSKLARTSQQHCDHQQLRSSKVWIIKIIHEVITSHLQQSTCVPWRPTCTCISAMLTLDWIFHRSCHPGRDLPERKAETQRTGFHWMPQWSYLKRTAVCMCAITWQYRGATSTHAGPGERETRAALNFITCKLRSHWLTNRRRLSGRRTEHCRRCSSCWWAFRWCGQQCLRGGGHTIAGGWCAREWLLGSFAQ